MTNDWRSQAAKLECRAASILSCLNERPRQRPLFVEFAGTPKSGKSSCIDSVSHFFRRMNFSVHAPSEGASKRTPKYLKEDLTAFNTWSACYALTQILESRHHSDRAQVAILDRGIFDPLVWFHHLRKQRSVTDEEYDAISEFLLLPKWRDDLDLVVLLTADPETAMARENSGKIVEHEGRAMNVPFLRALNISYREVAATYGERFPRFFEQDTSGDPSPREVAASVVDLMLSLLEADCD